MSPTPFDPNPTQLTPPSTVWQLRESDPTVVELLKTEADLPALVAQILAARGIASVEEAQRFLHPRLSQLHDPMELHGMEAAVARIGQAIRNGEPICVYGDYDVDGMTATSILLSALRELKADADYYIPHRFNEGYGLNCEALEKLAAEGNRLVVTVDCGITSVAEAARAKELGLALIITDHHEPGSELPQADALINPKLPQCQYPFKGLAGAGVSFKLAHALFRAHHPDPERAKEFIKSLLDLVTLGTVADVVPLVDENRAIVSEGLKLITRSPRPGIKKLLEHAGAKRDIVDATTIGFVLGPRLNAAGRTEHAMFGAELLLTEDMQEADQLAQKLEGFNLDRRHIEQEILDEAFDLLADYIDDPVWVIEQEGWHHGVLGIVASRIKELHHRPTFILGIDGESAKGSGRSVPGFDLHAALEACSEHLLKFGGHKMAAGMTCATENIDAFREALKDYARENLSEEMRKRTVRIDAEVCAEDINAQAIKTLAALAPHGAQNPKPVISLCGCYQVEAPRLLKERHLKLKVAAPDGSQFPVIGWGMGHRIAEIEKLSRQIDIAGTPFLNHWNGRTTVEIEMKDFRVVGD